MPLTVARMLTEVAQALRADGLTPQILDRIRATHAFARRIESVYTDPGEIPPGSREFLDIPILDVDSILAVCDVVAAMSQLIEMAAQLFRREDRDEAIVNMTAARLDKAAKVLSKHQSAKRVAKKHTSSRKRPRIVARPRPLTQKQKWALHLWEENNHDYAAVARLMRVHRKTATEHVHTALAKCGTDVAQKVRRLTGRGRTRPLPHDSRGQVNIDDGAVG